MSEFIELDSRYSTTRRLRKVAPEVVGAELKAAHKPEDRFDTILFLPKGQGRKGEGGLRTRGFFKKGSDEKSLITVITVVFNGEEHLEETILSVINQTYDNVEYIIIDGGSTDGTLDIIKKYEHAIDYWVSERDNGIYDAMNKGAKLTTGVALCMLNCGDYIINCGFKNLIMLFVDYKKTHQIDVIVYGKNVWRGKSPGVGLLPDFLPALGRLPSHQAMLIPTGLQLAYKYKKEFPISADKDFKLSTYLGGTKYVMIDLGVCESTPGGISQKIVNFGMLRSRTKETFNLFRKHYGVTWSFLYSVVFFIWNARKLLVN